MAKLIYTGSEWSFDLLEKAYNECEKIAFDELKLRIYPNQLEIISSEQMLDAYSSSGLPILYKHWSHGKHFSIEERNYKKGYTGLAYEIVINSNPCINYLMEENTMTMQTMVIAHAAFGHNHFFKNNYLFRQWTDASHIIDYLIFAKNYINDCEEKYGSEVVEKILDSCHAIARHGISRYKRPVKLNIYEETEKKEEREEYLRKVYNDLWRTVPKTKKQEEKKKDVAFSDPEENVLYFIEKNSPILKPWQRELVRIIRKINQYFYPQMQCLTGNHLVSNEFGLIRLDNLIKQEGIVENPNINLLTLGDKQTTVSHTYKRQANTLIVKTASGRTFTATPEHPLQVLSDNNVNVEMRKIQDMKVGDNLVYKIDYDIFSKHDIVIKYPAYSTTDIKCKLCNLVAPSIASHVCQTHNLTVEYYEKHHGPCISDNYRLSRSKNKLLKMPKCFDENSARLFGYLTNAYVSPITRPDAILKLVTDSVEVADDIIGLLNNTFGIIVNYQEYFSCYKIEFSSMMLKNVWYKNINITRRYEMPEFVFKLKKSYVTSFLNGFFDSRISKDKFQSARLVLSGYSDDYEDMQLLSVILTGLGILTKITSNKRDSYQSIAFALGIPDCKNIKAIDYSFKIYVDSINDFYNTFDIKHSNIKRTDRSNHTTPIPGALELFRQVKNIINNLKKKHTSSKEYKKSNYQYKIKNNLLLTHTGLDCIALFPNLKLNKVCLSQITNECIDALENIKHCDSKIELLLKMINNAKSQHYDSVVSIEPGNIEWVYDVTIPENHLFWTNNIISHNTKVMNEGWASFTHFYTMNRLHEKGLITDGAILEFLHMHSGVVYQPDFNSKRYRSFNPYYLGFEMFKDIKRVCENPTEEDKEWFPDFVNTDWLDTCLNAVANYRDESFIRQFLSPTLIRKMKLFTLNNNTNEEHYIVEHIHNKEGYKHIRETLASQYEVGNMIPDIQVHDAKFKGDRTLILHHNVNNGKLLNKVTDDVLSHIKRLWGYQVVLESIENGEKKKDYSTGSEPQLEIE